MIRDIRAKFGIPNSPQSPDIGEILDGSISDFRISGQSLIKENCRNSRTSDDMDMKLRPVIKFDKRKKTLSKRFDDDFMSANRDAIDIFPIYGQSGAIRMPDPGRTVCKINIFINSNLLSLQKLKAELKKSLTQSSHYCFE